MDKMLKGVKGLFPLAFLKSQNFYLGKKMLKCFQIIGEGKKNTSTAFSNISSSGFVLLLFIHFWKYFFPWRDSYWCLFFGFDFGSLELEMET